MLHFYEKNGFKFLYSTESLETGKTYVMASVVKWFLYFLFFLNVINEKE